MELTELTNWVEKKGQAFLLINCSRPKIVCFPIFQIIFNSIAYETGLKDRDYVVEINNTKVFEMSHDDCKDLIRKAGDHLQIKIER